MSYLPLLGVLIILLGFALKWDTFAVVIIAAFVTPLLAGMSVTKVLTLLGQSFLDNRMVSLYFLVLPMIGLVESHGLRQVAINAIKKLKRATPGKVLSAYMLIREVLNALGISLNGQIAFVRPLVAPMATASAASYKLSDADKELLKGRSAAVDNLGNFFSQNCFMASSGVLLISSTMKSLKHGVSPLQIALYSIPFAVITFILTYVYNYFMDKRLAVKEEA